MLAALAVERRFRDHRKVHDLVELHAVTPSQRPDRPKAVDRLAEQSYAWERSMPSGRAGSGPPSVRIRAAGSSVGSVTLSAPSISAA